MRAVLYVLYLAIFIIAMSSCRSRTIRSEEAVTSSVATTTTTEVKETKGIEQAEREEVVTIVEAYEFSDTINSEFPFRQHKKVPYKGKITKRTIMTNKYRKDMVNKVVDSAHINYNIKKELQATKSENKRHEEPPKMVVYFLLGLSLCGLAILYYLRKKFS